MASTTESYGTHFAKVRIEDIFGYYSFGNNTQQSYLSPKTCAELRKSATQHTPLSPSIADDFAAGVLRWAVERGATHFTHWFVPLTGRSAQKHDSFVKVVGDRVISQFSGKMLTIAEPDGSSFPSGGLRSTHEARGYTVWDPSVPPFIINHRTGATLYIPAVFFSWKGSSMDEKLPLLRANEVLSRDGLRMLKSAGQGDHGHLFVNCGVEQEFFLIDSNFALARPDLLQCGRCLCGNVPPKGQKLDDHYFGDLSERTMQLINDVERELWKLGIPQTTRHKEVAPGQYEIAPWYTNVSVACDHNILAMETIQRVAHHYGMEALFHEKPYAGLNGSGKHNNWSIGTGKTGTVFTTTAVPNRNLLFMLFAAATLRAVDIHQDLMRIAVASAGNDHRLGADEAPPAIISVYLGEEVDVAIKKFIAGDESATNFETKIDVGAHGLPEFERDSTDRNRTSPFAFTGNKFEFRAVGGSQTPHRSSYILNAIVAESCGYIADEIEKLNPKTEEERQAAAKTVTRKILGDHQRIIFNGDAYSKEWHAEAEKRGLLNLRNTSQSFERLTDSKNIALFEKMGIFDEESLRARQNAWLEEYVQKITIEADTLSEIVSKKILPAASSWFNTMCICLNNATVQCGGEAGNKFQESRVTRVAQLIEQMISAADHMSELVKKVHAAGSEVEQAKLTADELVPAVEAVRVPVDALEQVCPANDWPLPTYQDMLFTGQTGQVATNVGGSSQPTAVQSGGPTVSGGRGNASALWF